MNAKPTHDPDAAFTARLNTAAEMYARGMPLEKVRAELGMCDRTFCAFTRKHRALWKAAVSTALAGIGMADQEPPKQQLRALNFYKNPKPPRKPRKATRIFNPDANGQPYRVSDAPGTLWHICVNQYFPRKFTIRSEGTKLKYRFAIRDLTEFLGRDPTIADLTDETLMGMMRHRQSKGIAPKTINEAACSIRCLWEFLARLRIVPTFPTFTRLPEPRNPPEAWSEEQLVRLFKACRSQVGMVHPQVPLYAWWTALLLVLWDSGERIGAIMACRWEWLDFDKGVLRIPAAARKGGNHGEQYLLHANTLEWLKVLRPLHPELIFGSIHFSTRYTRYKKLLRSAGLPTGRNCGFHKMRRSVGSHIAFAGHNATDALRHSSAKVTKQSYLDPSIVGVVSPSEILFRPNAASVPKKQKLPGAPQPVEAMEVAAMAWL